MVQIGFPFISVLCAFGGIWTRVWTVTVIAMPDFCGTSNFLCHLTAIPRQPTARYSDDTVHYQKLSVCVTHAMWWIIVTRMRQAFSPLDSTAGWLSHLALAIYMFIVVVNFDALAQAGDLRIERGQVVSLCWIQDSYPGSLEPNLQQTAYPLT